MKKLLMSALVAAMCLGLGATAFAASTPSTAGPAFSDIAGNDAEFALTALGALGIYTGDNGIGGAVKPDDPITRAQFCKVVVAASGRTSTAAGLAGLQPTFTDGATIPTWAWGSVNVAVYMGIINGYADGSFGPNNPVTYAEAVTMLIRMVSGHAAQVGAGLWPYNMLFYGVDNGFVGGVDVGFANLPATRGDVAEMVFATMQINKLNAKGEELERNFPNPGDPDTALLAGRVEKALLREFDAAGNHCQLGGTIFDLPGKVYLAGATAPTGLLNVNCIAVLDADEKVCAIGKNEDASVVTGVYKQFKAATTPGANDQWVLVDGTLVPEDGSESYMVNGVAGAATLAAGDEVAITLDEKGVAAFVVITRFQDLDYIAANGVTKSHKDGATEDPTAINPMTLAAFDVPANCVVTVNGASADRDTLLPFDVFQVALNGSNAVVLRVHREVVEGTVTGNTTTYSGSDTVRKVSIALKAGGTKTFTVNDEDGYVSALPGKDANVKYGLDAAGNLFVPIAYEASTPFVLVKSLVVNGDGTASATVDVRGTEVTYKVEDDAGLRDDLQTYAEAGDLAWIEVRTSDNTIVDCSDIVLDGGTWFYVVAVSDAGLTLVDTSDPTAFLFIAADADITVYKVTDDGYVYIAAADLTVDDTMILDANFHVHSHNYDADGADEIAAQLVWTWEKD